MDDVFIFSDSEPTARLVYDVYADLLVAFNLHANTEKLTTLRRPFLTTKSTLIYEAGRQANDFFGKLFVEAEQGTLTPKKVFSQWKLTKSYIDSIKALCSSRSSNYDEVASFLTSVITERIKRLVNNDLSADSADCAETYLSAFNVLIDVLFFLYSVAPSVGASYKLSTSLILAFRFSKRHLPEYHSTLSQQLYDLAATLLLEQCGKSHAEGVEGFVNLEYLNIVLAIRELGDSYLLPKRVLNDLFLNGKNLTYFTIVSCLFYIRNDKQYEEVRKKIIKAVVTKLANLTDILMSSEKAYLLLDMLSCPYIPDKEKSRWIKKLYAVLQKTQPGLVEINAFLSTAKATHWQVDWADVDLLNSLEKKELKQAY